MPKNVKPYFTRSASLRFCGGTPIEKLPVDLCTYRSIIRFSYFVQSRLKLIDIVERAKYISTELMNQWEKVNSELPLISHDSVTKRVKRLLDKVHLINQKKAPPSSVKALNDKLDSLFDISACDCELPVRECSDRQVNCKIKNCRSMHIVCQCNQENRVPIEERQYLKDQKEKKGQKGAYQMGSRVLTKNVNSKAQKSDASHPICDIDTSDEESQSSFSEDEVSKAASHMIISKLFAPIDRIA